MTKSIAIQKLEDLFRSFNLEFIPGRIKMHYVKKYNRIDLEVYTFGGGPEHLLFMIYNNDIFLHSHIQRSIASGSELFKSQSVITHIRIYADMLRAFSNAEFRNSISSICLEYHPLG